MPSKAIVRCPVCPEHDRAGASPKPATSGLFLGGGRRGPDRGQRGAEDLLWQLRVRGALRSRDARHKGIVGEGEGSVARSGDLPGDMTALPFRGVALKPLWMGAPRWLSVALYLGMGWSRHRPKAGWGRPGDRLRVDRRTRLRCGRADLWAEAS